MISAIVEHAHSRPNRDVAEDLPKLVLLRTTTIGERESASSRNRSALVYGDFGAADTHGSGAGNKDHDPNRSNGGIRRDRNSGAGACDVC